MSKQVTIRGVTPDLDRRLQALSRARGKSVNAVVLDILRDAVGVNERRERLTRYATATADDFRELEEARLVQRTIEPELWK